MATATYTAIASITLGSSASSVEFSSIPQDYRDLVLVVNASITNPIQGVEIFMNGLDETGANVAMFGDGSSTSSFTSTNIFALMGADTTAIIQFMDYSATDKHKTALIRTSTTSGRANAQAVRKAITAAITSIKMEDSNSDFAAGGTFALYGIEA